MFSTGYLSPHARSPPSVQVQGNQGFPDVNVYEVLLTFSFCLYETAMTEDKPADTPAIPPEIRDLLGPAPVLSSEDPKRYERILNNLAQCVQPRDIIEWMLVRDLTDERWEIERLRRFKHQLVEEVYGVHAARTTAVIEAGFVTEVWGLCATARGVLTGEQLEPAVKTKREQQLDADINNLTTKTGKQLVRVNKAPTSADFARVTEQWLLSYERIEKLERAAQCAFDGVLEQIERHREGLGLLLRKAEQIIEGEFKEVPSSLSPDEVPPPASSPAMIEPTPSPSERSAGLKGAPGNERVAARKSSPISSLVSAPSPRGEHNSGGGDTDDAGGLQVEANGGTAMSGEPFFTAMERALGLHSRAPSISSLEELVGVLPPTDAAHRRK